jgi:hypothetical protein
MASPRPKIFDSPLANHFSAVLQCSRYSSKGVDLQHQSGNPCPPGRQGPAVSCSRCTVENIEKQSHPVKRKTDSAKPKKILDKAPFVSQDRLHHMMESSDGMK